MNITEKLIEQTADEVSLELIEMQKKRIAIMIQDSITNGNPDIGKLIGNIIFENNAYSKEFIVRTLKKLLLTDHQDTL